jgi:hypothetical protein
VASSPSKVIARAWQDPAFKQKLVSNPTAALADEGIQVPAGHTVTVHQNSANETHIVLPATPASGIAQNSAAPASAGFWCVWCAADSTKS